MRLIGVVLIASLLGGCVSVQQPVSLSPSFWENRQQTIGVAVVKPNPPTAYMTGNQGLLDYAINRSNASKLIDYLEKMELPKLSAIPDEFIAQLKARGFQVKKIDEPLDTQKLAKFSKKSEGKSYAELDVRSYKEQGIDRLLLINVERVGTTRNYYGFIPTTPPQAEISIKGQLVDLDTNELLWYTNDVTTAAIPEPWDQPPSFDNVAMAVKSNTDNGIEKLEQSFFAGPVQ